ncbi:hypothetical protein SAY87_010194 [Trapa incisa]|uniref:AT-hook motif nuclear-localized protein n=1 Tax=Trapa incisa TaxID=236973 RepID=A0AAN7GQ55_9MYRT|nr:hypothetical protein SAY87_010194 [Trapa incisa]
MEGRDGDVSSSGGVTVVRSEAPLEYHVAPRSDSSRQTPGSGQPPASGQMLALWPAVEDLPVKKKRGRPRKYGPDSSEPVILSPRPLSSVALPSVIDFSVQKRGKVKSVGSVSKPKFEVENLGQWVACSGANFTPHIITVNAGEDVTMKIISFSQQGPQSVCILSANGIIASVTLRQPDSSGGTLTYEGRFEILSLSGSFMPNETGGTRGRSGGMSISLASPDGRVVGGGVAGLLVAASPVQVVVGSFLSGNQHEQKKQPKHDPISAAIPTAAVPISTANPKGNISTSPSYLGDNSSSLPSDSKNKPADMDASFMEWKN